MGKYDALISKLWPGDSARATSSRATAHKFVARFGDMPMAADRVEPGLREAAHLDELVANGTLTQAEANARLGSFIQDGLGTPPHILAEYQAWTQGMTAELDATEASAEPEKPAAAQPPAAAPARPAMTAAPAVDQATLQQQIELHQRNMRAPEGSAEWRAYWREGGSVQYLAALQAMEAAEASPQPATPADGGMPTAAPLQPGTEQ
jgi:hypothetical protein